MLNGFSSSAGRAGHRSPGRPAGEPVEALCSSGFQQGSEPKNAWVGSARFPNHCEVVSVHGGGEGPQRARPGEYVDGQLWNRCNAGTATDQGQDGGEIEHFGDNSRRELGDPAGPVDHFVTGPPGVRDDPVAVGEVGQVRRRGRPPAPVAR